MKQLKRLPQKEQGVVSRTVLDLQMDPTTAALSLHRVDGNAGWWSAYANGDLRIILRREGDGRMILCWTDHHDRAYLWARNHVLSRHPVMGSMQIVEIPEVVAAQPVEKLPGAAPRPEPRVVGPSRTPLCARLGIGRGDLLGWGVPEVWVERVLAATDADELLDVGEHHLPPEVAEAVLSIAVGERPADSAGGADDDASVDAEADLWNGRNWWVVSRDDDLRAVLENADWDAWCVYLHPSQRAIAYRTYDGPFRVSGSAGTGKTVVALHHARHVLRSDDRARVAVLTYSRDLAADLQRRLRPLLSARELERCHATTVANFARELYDGLFPGHPPVIHREDLRREALQILTVNAALLPKGISPRFALSELERIVEPRQIRTEEEYLRTVRRGVHTRLSAERRRAVWSALRKVYDGVNSHDGYVTVDQMYAAVAERLRANPGLPRYYTHIVVDECQDLCEAELELLKAYLGESRRIFFAGDQGQRIIRFSFPWRPHGVDLRGRSRVLKVNYRTTHEIRTMADRLTNEEVADADEIVSNRRGTVSLLSGPRPEIRQFADVDAEVAGVAAWLSHLHDDLGIPGHAVAIFHRSENERERAERALRCSSYQGEWEKPNVIQMFRAKGLEYRAAAVMGCDNDVIPSPERLAEADLVAGLEEIYDTERNLLYVACTRARDYLLVTSAGIPSELLLDMVAR